MTSPGDKHYTASAIILSTGNPTKVLLLHHAKLDKWIQPGGHQEPNENAYEGAIREALEETGINIADYLPAPVRLDEYSEQLPVPDLILEEHIDAHGTEPEHIHLDMMYIVRIPEQPVQVEAGKAHDLRWFTIEEVERLKTFEELRMTLRREMAPKAAESRRG